MNPNLIWSIALAAVGILGIYLAGRKNLWGWAVGFGAQVLWLIFGLITGQYGFILSAIAYGIVYARNWLKWRADTPELTVTITADTAGFARGISPLLPRTAAFALVAREDHERLLDACELTDTPPEIAEWLLQTMPWNRAEVTRRLLAGEGPRWTERHRLAHTNRPQAPNPEGHPVEGPHDR